MNICLCVANFKSDLVEAISKSVVGLAIKLGEKDNCTFVAPGDLPELSELPKNLKLVSYAPELDYHSKVRIFYNIIALGQYFKKHPDKYDVVHYHAGNLLELFLIWVCFPKIDTVRVVTVWQPFIGLREFIKLPWRFRKNIKGIIHHFLLNTFLHFPLYVIGQSYFSKIIVHTKFQKAQLRFLKDSKVKVFANGVDRTEYVYSPENDIFSILYVGHATAVKGLDVLLQALHQIKDKAVFRVVIAVSSFENINLETLIDKYGLNKQVTIKGWVNVYKEMSNNNLLILPHKTSVGTSCFPNIILESFAVGIPVVATSTEVLSELIDDGVTGFLVPPDNSAALANSIMDFIDDPKLATEISVQQRAVFNNSFAFEQFVEAHRNLYQILLSGARPA